MVVRATVELLSTDVAMLTNQIYLTQPQPPSSAPALPFGDRECDSHTIRRLDASTNSLLN